MPTNFGDKTPAGQARTRAVNAIRHFERLVAEHERDVLRAAWSILRDEHLGLDAAQDAFARLWRAIASGKAPERAAAWLRRAAVSSALDLQRRRAARPLELLPIEKAAALDDDPSAIAGHRELVERFQRAVSRLPEGQRTIFLLRHEGGYPLSEVAEALELALPTVKTQFARACLKLHQALRAFEDDHGE
jgi:RNA polymerase sigma-70 factor (ECF subfamily)